MDIYFSASHQKSIEGSIYFTQRETGFTAIYQKQTLETSDYCVPIGRQGNTIAVRRKRQRWFNVKNDNI